MQQCMEASTSCYQRLCFDVDGLSLPNATDVELGSLTS